MSFKINKMDWKKNSEEMDVQELRSELQKRGAPTHGLKAVLKNRLSRLPSPEDTDHITSRSSRSEVLEAVKQNGGALYFASAALKDDREIVLEVVKQHGKALEYASAALKDDRDIVLEAVKQNRCALKHASAALKDDREIVLEAVKTNPWALQYASAALKDDRNIVLEAVHLRGGHGGEQ